jgi:hypothetical protein
MEQGRPESGRVTVLDSANYRKRHFKRVCKDAGIGHYSPKDLRDTFASQLITAGITVSYVSIQLGHGAGRGNTALTEKHYGRFLPRGGYQNPILVEEGEHPADLLVRLNGEESHQSHITSSEAPSP